MMKSTHICLLLIAATVLTMSCRQHTLPADPTAPSAEREESSQAKALLQGIWIESETEEVAFRAEGDTIYYPDPTSQPAYFCIIGDSLVLGDNRYAIVRQSEHLFAFRNQAGDVRQLVKSEVEEDTLLFVRHQPEILTLTEVLKIDSVVNYGGERYHWYVAINPTRYRVVKTIYNSEGVGVDNVYFDNIIHISLYHGSKCVYSRDFRKQMYAENVPQEFLEQAILGNMQYDHADALGVHFNATLCIPDEASCYMVETLIGFDGQMSMRLLEY